MAKTEMIRVRVEPDLKKDAGHDWEAHYTTSTTDMSAIFPLHTSPSE